MTPIDALKSGVKTGLVVLITGLVALVTQVTAALQSAATTGNPPNLSFVTGAAYTLAIAFVVGASNALMRYLQVAAVPFLGALFDKILGQVPKYLPPPEGLGDIGDDGKPAANKPYDRGDIGLIEVLLVAIAVGVGFVLAKLY